MNCTAWNSVRAKPAGEQAQGGAEHGVDHGDHDSSQTGPATSRPHTQTAKPVATSACRTAITPNARA